MDIVTRQYFKNFLTEFRLNGGESDSNFEKFINYIMLSTKNINNFELSSTIVGDGDDCGIDGFAISLNNKFVSSKMELDELINMNLDFEAVLYFIQTKTTSSFDGSEMLTFGNGVRDVLQPSELAGKRRNQKLIEKCEMIQGLVENYRVFTKGVRCELYYVTTGKWMDDQNLKSDISTIVNLLQETGFFSSTPQFFAYGASDIRRTYELTKVQNHASFDLKDRIELPYIQTIDESYLGIMPVKEYLNLIADEERRIKSGIFELNVRDYQGSKNNQVNQDIQNTILSKDKEFFGFLNNGITIVGKSLTKIQGKFHIKNFYIVNGCQTSNVLNEQYDSIDDNMWVSVKIIITNNDEIIQNVVRATNNQTEVEAIQFESFDAYQKDLESYFLCQEFYPLYYERRKGQYNSNDMSSATQIITPQIAIRAFASVFQEVPHRASRFYGTLEEEIGEKIFVLGHYPILYYTASLVHHKLEIFINNGSLPDNLHKFKYHFMSLIARSVLKKEKRPQYNSKKIEEYCSLLINAIIDEEKFKVLVSEMIQIIEKVVTDLRNTEITKSYSTFQSMCMYQDLKITDMHLNVIPNYLRTVDMYLTPFRSMKIYGDLRYNFKNHLRDLCGCLRSFGLKDIANDIERFHSEDFQTRIVRQKISLEIIKKVEVNYHYNANLLDRAQKYIKSDSE